MPLTQALPKQQQLQFVHLRWSQNCKQYHDETRLNCCNANCKQTARVWLDPVTPQSSTRSTSVAQPSDLHTIGIIVSYCVGKIYNCMTSTTRSADLKDTQWTADRLRNGYFQNGRFYVYIVQLASKSLSRQTLASMVALSVQKYAFNQASVLTGVQHYQFTSRHVSPLFQPVYRLMSTVPENLSWFTLSSPFIWALPLSA
jgi:hypothetical protein